jgi:hypothetical protein
MKSFAKFYGTKKSFDFSKHTAESLNIEHETILTTYTSQLKTGIPELDIYLLSSKQPFKVFAAHAKVKKAVKNCGLEIPDINESDLKYYSISQNLKPGNFGAVTCLDIKAAYPTALKNIGYIDPETYDYLMKQDKQTRLTACGMLAGTKHVFKYNGAELLDFEIIEKETKPVFLAAVVTIDEILEKTAEIAGSDFLFFWVDGIYLRTPAKIADIKKLWRDFGYNYSEEFLNNFRVEKNERGKLFVNFEKEGKIKKFNLPTPQNKAQKAILNEFREKLNF